MRYVVLYRTTDTMEIGRVMVKVVGGGSCRVQAVRGASFRQFMETQPSIPTPTEYRSLTAFDRYMFIVYLLKPC